MALRSRTDGSSDEIDLVHHTSGLPASDNDKYAFCYPMLLAPMSTLTEVPKVYTPAATSRPFETLENLWASVAHL